MNENKSVENEGNENVKRGRGRPAGSVSNKPKATCKTKSCRIPLELLPTVDNLIALHKEKATDGRSKWSSPGNQKRVAASEVRHIPLQFLPIVESMLAAWRAKSDNV